MSSIYILSKNKKTIKKCSTENFDFLQVYKSLYIAWPCFVILCFREKIIKKYYPCNPSFSTYTFDIHVFNKIGLTYFLRCIFVDDSI